MAFLLIPGHPIEDFRTRRLLQRLQAALPALRSLQLQEFFLVDADEDVAPGALHELLDVNEGPALASSPSSLYGVPRVGTLSPWASKATDIAAVCGLTGVRRIERGRAYCFDGIDSLPANLRGELHD